MRQMYIYLRTFISRIRLLMHFIFNTKMYLNKKTYYPEKELKSYIEIFFDFVEYILRHGEIDISYYDLGLDVKGRSYKNYLSYNEYMIRRNRLNLTKPFNYVCLLRNKSLFSSIGKLWGFPVISDIAKMKDGKIIESHYENILSLLKENHHIFIKPIDSKRGEEIHEVDYIDNHIFLDKKLFEEEAFQSFMIHLSNEFELLIQNKIIQHSEVAAIYSNSVNTLRIVTINHKHSSQPNEIYIMGVELRLGANGNFTDNISAGGIKIGVNEDGKLCKYGFYNRKYGTKTTCHPDSKIVFEGYSIPYYKEAIQLCKEFHAKIKEVHLIGWDVAITENGPLVIEGNDDCGTDFQVLFGPMKSIYDKYLPNI